MQIFKNDQKIDFSIEIEKDLVDIFALVLIQNSAYSSNQSIIHSLENAILSKNINNIILNSYQIVIKTKQYQTNNLSNILDILVDLLGKNNQFEKLNLEIIACIALASEYLGISKIEALENNLVNNDAIISWWSFRGLRAAYERGIQSVIFEEWCTNISNRLEESIHTCVIHDLDLFETMTAIKYIDYTKILNKMQNQWNRELLIFDLVERFQISEENKFSFYKTWLEIEENEKFHQGKSNSVLKLLHRIQFHLINVTIR